MATFLFDDIIFGPVKSRRLGNSLGINLLPENKKVCNFNCVYCECGWTKQTTEKLPKTEDILYRIKNDFFKLAEKNIEIDTITFAGNGEPTLHPDFDIIVDECILQRNKFFPNAKIAVLTNATLLHKKKVENALYKTDQPLLKLDSVVKETIETINKPVSGFDFKKYIKKIREFKGNTIIQSMFIRYEKDGKTVDNSTEHEVELWLKEIEIINPKLVMIYSIARDTPDPNVKAVPKERLLEIGEKVNKLGIKTEVS